MLISPRLPPGTKLLPPSPPLLLLCSRAAFIPLTDGSPTTYTQQLCSSPELSKTLRLSAGTKEGTGTASQAAWCHVRMALWKQGALPQDFATTPTRMGKIWSHFSLWSQSMIPGLTGIACVCQGLAGWILDFEYIYLLTFFQGIQREKPTMGYNWVAMFPWSHYIICISKGLLSIPGKKKVFTFFRSDPW